MAKSKGNDLVIATNEPAAVTRFEADLQSALAPHIKIKETITVTRPVLSQIGRDGVPFAITAEGPIVKAQRYVRTDSDGNPLAPDPNQPEMPPPDLMNVIDLSDGVEKILVVNAMLASALRRNYPNDTYVGKSFGIVGMRKPHKGGWSIRDYFIRELILE